MGYSLYICPNYLITNPKRQMEKRPILLDINTAKELLKSQDPYVKVLVLGAYPELDVPCYPTWVDLQAKGYCIDIDGSILHTNHGRTNQYEGDKSVWPTKGLAEAALALSQLTQICKAYLEIDSVNSTPSDPAIIYVDTKNELRAKNKCNFNKTYPLEFRYLKSALYFYNAYSYLLEKAKPLL